MTHKGNQVGVGGSDQLVRNFAYDPLYRLIEAGGREQSANPLKPWEYLPNGGNANDPVQTRQYTENYTYDAVGSLTKLEHFYGIGTGKWVRDYVTESTSNRLASMTSAGVPHAYVYDAAGNLIGENTDRHHEWDWAGRMRAFRNQIAGGQASIFAHYTYDAGGQRVQKVVSKAGGNAVHSVYIDGIFEHHEEINVEEDVVAQNNVLHVMDDTKRVATRRLGAELDGSSPPAVQYHLGDHLQSSAVVVDATGAFFNREEYRPYGESSFGSYQKKRYRFTGKERDEESSLYYHGARYYAPWTARWTAPDPMGMVDGPNLYGYVSGNPVRLVDPNGSEGEDSTNPSIRYYSSTTKIFYAPDAAATILSVLDSRTTFATPRDAPSSISMPSEINDVLSAIRTWAGDQEVAGTISPMPTSVLFKTTERAESVRISGSKYQAPAPAILLRGLGSEFLSAYFHTHPPGRSNLSAGDMPYAAGGARSPKAPGFFAISDYGTEFLLPTLKTETVMQSVKENLFGDLTEVTQQRIKLQRFAEAATTEFMNELNTNGPIRAEVRREYGKLTLAHNLGLAYYRYEPEQEALIRVDLSSKESRLEAADWKVQQSAERSR
jgi:RHS repeat-associated protein